MTTLDPSEFGPVAPNEWAIGPKTAGRSQAPIFFNPGELVEILSLYGRMVALGEWRDYAIDGLKEAAVFSVFRRSSEIPLYRIEKRPKQAKRQGAYSVISATGHVLKRGQDLTAVLRVFDRRRFRVVEA